MAIVGHKKYIIFNSYIIYKKPEFFFYKHKYKYFIYNIAFKYNIFFMTFNSYNKL